MNVDGLKSDDEKNSKRISVTININAIAHSMSG